MFDVLKRAAITVPEFAKIVGVSRVTAYNWVAVPQRKAPHKLIQAKVTIALRVIEKLVDMQRLPLSEDLDKDLRREKIAKLKEIVDRTMSVN